jgi:threonine dehydrogenase-like Zn-dependent dehydrogenase
MVCDGGGRTMKRTVAKVVAPRKLEVMEEELPALGENQILLRILSGGLCHSDMPGYNGESTIATAPDGTLYMETNLEYPFEVGHEPSAVVEDMGRAVKGFEVGDHVGGPIMGSFASHAITDPGILVKIPDEVKEPKYCLPEPLMCISNIVRAANPEYGDFVAVIGCGMMGLLTLAGVSKTAAREVIGIDLMDSRLEWAGKMGATTALNPQKTDVVSEIKEITGGRGVDVVVEITGRVAGLQLACEIVRDASLFGSEGRGKILLPSLYTGKEIFESRMGYQLMFKSPILHSTHPWYSQDYMEDARRGVWGYVSGVLPLDKLITHEFKIEDIQKGFETAETGADDYIKGIVVP